MAGTAETLIEFFRASDQQQRHLFDESSNKKKAQATLRAFFEVIKKVRSDDDLVKYALAYLDGILEDHRARVSHFIAVMNDFKSPENLIAVLNSFIHENGGADPVQRDMASHVLALLIEAEKYDKC